MISFTNVASISVLFAFALPSGASPFGGPPVLYGTSWQLARIVGSGGTDSVDDKAKYTVSFGADGRASLRLDCNRATGAWTSATPGEIRFGPLAMTRAMCAAGSHSDRLARDLSRVAAYSVAFGHLILQPAAGDGERLDFEPLAAPPTFDCAKASADAEKLVCTDPNLAWLDRTLADVYPAAVNKLSSGEAAKQTDAQRAWSDARNACEKEQDAKTCIQSAYQRRIAELEIRAGLLPAPINAKCSCPGDSTITAAYYNSTDPASALFTYNGSEVVAIVQPSGSGARYGAPGVELWEHQGEAAVTWSGKQFNCKVAHE